MENEINETKDKVKRELSNYLGVDLEDIEDDTVLVEDLHMKATDLTDFLVILERAGFETGDIDFTEIQTFGDLVEALTAHI